MVDSPYNDLVHPLWDIVHIVDPALSPFTSAKCANREKEPFVELRAVLSLVAPRVRRRRPCDANLFLVEARHVGGHVYHIARYSRRYWLEES